MANIRAQQPQNAEAQHHNELNRAAIFRSLHNVTRHYNTSLFHSLGTMNELCEHCSSLQFSGENFLCCHNGKVTLPELSEHPQELYQLITGNSVLS